MKREQGNKNMTDSMPKEAMITPKKVEEKKMKKEQGSAVPSRLGSSIKRANEKLERT